MATMPSDHWMGRHSGVDLLGWVDVPALVHGNVIEVSTGMVGIDEACSGIRSFQSSLMISLFLGEFYRLSTRSRWLLVPAGFVEPARTEKLVTIDVDYVPDWQPSL